MTYERAEEMTKTHTCDFSDSVEDLQFLWIESTNIIVTVSVEDRSTERSPFLNSMRCILLYLCLFWPSGLLQNKVI